jgi:protein-disulfide isomerase
MQAEFEAMPPVPKPPKDKKAKSAAPGGNRTLIIVLAVAGVVAIALIAGSVLLTRGGGNDASSTTTGSGGTAAAVSLVAGVPQTGTYLGKPTAKVTMRVYEDLQCPYCKRFTDDGALPAIVDEYVKTGLVRLDWRGLAFLGPDSTKALQIALAAGKQNRLWEVMGLFYEKQGAENSGWVTDQLVDDVLASVPGLDAAKVKADAKSAEIANQIAAIQDEASTSGVNGTPSFFIVKGVNQPYQIQVTSLTPEAFRPVLNDALKG